MDEVIEAMTTLFPNTSSAPVDQSQPEGNMIAQLTQISLWVMFIIGLPGNLIVMIWIYLNHRRRSRINTIVLGLASADLAVCFFVILPNVLILHRIEQEFFCKLLYFTMGISLIASPNMVIVMAIDRHQAVIHPLKKFLAAWKLVSVGWVSACILASTQLAVWGVSKRKKAYCSTFFGSNAFNGSSNASIRQIYLSYIATVTFIFPFIVITYVYVRISCKIWQKAQETSGKRPSKKGKINLKRSANGSLSKAKNKTLKMTLVIIIVFLVCNLPYFIVEMLSTFDRTGKVRSMYIYYIFATFAPLNSALNPYVFLAFNLTKRCWDEFLITLSRLCPCCFRRSDGDWRQVRFSSSNSRFYHPSRTVVSEVTIVAPVNRHKAVSPAEDIDSL